MNRIKCLRARKRLSQAEFAKLFQVDQTAVSNWENGKNSIDIDIANQIADYFSVPLDFIYGKEFKVTRPRNLWRTDENEDCDRAKPDARDYFLFIYGCGVFVNDDSKRAALAVELTEQENALLTAFRGTTEEGRMKIIQAVLNICDDIEKQAIAGKNAGAAG